MNTIDKIIITSEEVLKRCYSSLEKLSENTLPIKLNKEYNDDGKRIYVDSNDGAIIVSKKALYKSVISRGIKTRANQLGYEISGGISKTFRKLKKTLGD